MNCPDCGAKLVPKKEIKWTHKGMDLKYKPKKGDTYLGCKDCSYALMSFTTWRHTELVEEAADAERVKGLHVGSAVAIQGLGKDHRNYKAAVITGETNKYWKVDKARYLKTTGTEAKVSGNYMYIVPMTREIRNTINRLTVLRQALSLLLPYLMAQLDSLSEQTLNSLHKALTMPEDALNKCMEAFAAPIGKTDKQNGDKDVVRRKRV